MTIDTLTKPAAVSAAEAIATAFSHVGEDDTEYRSGGLRDFFLYRDLGIAEATGGQVIAHRQGEPAAGGGHGGIVHFLFDYSPDMEYLEIVSPADFTTVDVEGPSPIPPPTPRK